MREIRIHFKTHKEESTDLLRGCIVAKYQWVQRRLHWVCSQSELGVWFFSRARDCQGRFLLGLLTVVSLARMHCGWQHKLGCSIWLP